VAGTFAVAPVRSLYVTMRDGVRIALDVLLPSPMPTDGKLPTVLIMTRYWRSTVGSEPDEISRLFVSHGYAVINGDVRGTGASFGVWRHHRNRDETLDFSEIMDWIVKQKWSDGRIAGWGVSYRANTVDWMVERDHPAFKAAVSRFPDYDPYAHLYFPGGVPNINFGKGWGLMVRSLDLNHDERSTPGSSQSRGVRPADEDPDGRTLALAIAQRREIPDVWQSLQQIVFRDDRPAAWAGWSMDDWGIHSWARNVQVAATAIESWGGWMDAGTSDGVLRRFMTLSNPQHVIIGPWSHGGFHGSDPFLAADSPRDPTMATQELQDLCFIQREMAGVSRSAHAEQGKLLSYYTLGEQRWKTSTTWPIVGTQRVRWYLQSGHSLASQPPSEAVGADTYKVDFDATTGQKNRWWTQLTRGEVVYAERAERDKHLLTYSTAPLNSDTEITGHAVISLQVESSQPDGAFFVYLEDVAPDGAVTYVTEGELRAIHRRISAGPPPYRVEGPYHSFKRSDALPLVPGQVAELSFELLPTSVLIRKGHRVRVAIAGADKDTFQRIPETGDAVITIERNRNHASYLDLPVVSRH
jgi:uncharacterized protein